MTLDYSGDDGDGDEVTGNTLQCSLVVCDESGHTKSPFLFIFLS